MIDNNKTLKTQKGLAGMHPSAFDCYVKFYGLIKEGDFVRVKFGVKEKTYNRKAKLIGIDELSSIGSYPDRYTICMCKTGEEIDCTRPVIERW